MKREVPTLEGDLTVATELEATETQLLPDIDEDLDGDGSDKQAKQGINRKIALREGYTMDTLALQR